MMNQTILRTSLPPLDRKALNRRWRVTAWGIFTLMTFLVWLYVDGVVGYSLWFLATGIVLLGLNVARALADIAPGRASLISGVVALGVGLSILLEVGPLLPLLLLLIGFFAVVRS